MSFFKRSGVYNLDCFGRVEYKTMSKSKTNMGTQVFIQASGVVNNYFNKNKFLLPYLHSVILLLHYKIKMLFYLFGTNTFFRL